MKSSVVMLTDRAALDGLTNPSELAQFDIDLKPDAAAAVYAAALGRAACPPGILVVPSEHKFSPTLIAIDGLVPVHPDAGRGGTVVSLGAYVLVRAAGAGRDETGPEGPRARWPGRLRPDDQWPACAYTSMCEPMMTVRSRGRPKYSAASAVM
jgi:hypothetical protein